MAEAGELVSCSKVDENRTAANGRGEKVQTFGSGFIKRADRVRIDGYGRIQTDGIDW